MQSTMEPSAQSGNPGLTLERVGTFLIRYSLALTLIWVGALKFTSYEAEAIKPFTANSPLLSWVYNVLSVRNYAMILGSGEIVLGLLIAARPIAPLVSAVGSLGAAVLFAVTVTFLLTTPGVWQDGFGVPFLSPMPGQFLAKDLTLLAVSIWTAGEALRAANERRRSV